MKIKYNTTVYNKANPMGKDITRTAIGEEVTKPNYLVCDNDLIFIKTDKNIIHVIEPTRILEINGNKVTPCRIVDNYHEKTLNTIYMSKEEAEKAMNDMIAECRNKSQNYDFDVVIY